MACYEECLACRVVSIHRRRCWAQSPGINLLLWGLGCCEKLHHVLSVSCHSFSFFSQICSDNVGCRWSSLKKTKNKKRKARFSQNISSLVPGLRPSLTEGFEKPKKVFRTSCFLHAFGCFTPGVEPNWARALLTVLGILEWEVSNRPVFLLSKGMVQFFYGVATFGENIKNVFPAMIDVSSEDGA